MITRPSQDLIWPCNPVSLPVPVHPEERRQIIPLPRASPSWHRSKRFVLHGSNLVRIPPEIGAMTELEEFSPYTAYRLHWFPYEITRCSNLTRRTPPPT